MKKFIALTLVLLITIFNSTKIQAEEESVIEINYFRYEADFDDWHLWMWTDSSNGRFVEFDESSIDGSWITATIDLTIVENECFINSSIGFIVTKGEWLEKDIDSDRFIEHNSSVSSVYLGQGDSRIGYSIDDENGPDISHKFLSANFIDSKTISFKSTKEITSYELYSDDSLEKITEVNVIENVYTIQLSNSVNLKKKYLIKGIIDNKNQEIEVGFSALYDTKEFMDEYDYDGVLGVIYSESKSVFRVWSPLSDDIYLNLYEYGLSGYDNHGNIISNDKAYKSYQMNRLDKGVYEITVNGDLNGVYYTYTVERGIHSNEIVDPYAYTTGANGSRGMVIDFDKTNPNDWNLDKPDTVENYNDHIIYELHVRDLTSHSSWDGVNSGKYLGLVEEGTSYNNLTTGLDHIKELGVTSVHLLPVHDFGMIDETRLDEEGYYDKTDGGFNWGYMTENYNSLEGSYSTNPFDGSVRVNEFKQMVQGFHNNDIRVIMDVVYNHTSKSSDSNFNILMPGYYHRVDEEGSFSNGSGCGNETASERTMMRKLMVDSLCFYATEYNISGFRFDLMKLHDIDTMNLIAKELHDIDPSIIIYGEPWDAGGSSLDESESASKENYNEMPEIAIFNDNIRDAIKGSVFISTATGFVQGASDDETITKIKNGLTGNFAPSQMINYVSAHDNNTLNDKLKLTGLKGTQLEYAHKQSNAIVLLSQGIPFLHAGVEMCRSKPDEEYIYSHNSYNQADSVNQIRWDLKEQNIDMFNYYKALIEIRKNHSAFRMNDIDMINESIEFLDSPDGTIAMLIKDNANNDTWNNIIIAFNNNSASKSIDLPDGQWTVVGDKQGIDTNGIYEANGTMSLSSYDTVIMYNGVTEVNNESNDFNILAAISISIVVIGLAVFIKNSTE